jgi:hypothetical protein
MSANIVRSFPRKRESRTNRESKNLFWIPAFAGMSGREIYHE